MSAFWRLGYVGTSLEELSDATDMNRPSMYAAFGDKRTLYLKTLDAYIASAGREIARALDSKPTAAEGLAEFFEMALSWYLPQEAPPRGCYLIATAATECTSDAEVRQRLQDAVATFDRLVEQRLRRAQAEGELAADADPVALASLVLAVNHTLAFRSRAGVPAAELRLIIEGSIKAICGNPGR